MKTIKFRIVASLIAILFGITVVMVFMKAGNAAKGPLEQLFAVLSNSVRGWESRVMLQARTEKRSDKLDWFQEYKQNLSLLRNPSNMLLGAFDNGMQQSLESIIELEDSLRTTFPLVHIYTAWGDKREQQFPIREVNAIVASGSVPVITWEPWLTAFDELLHPHLRPIADRDKNGMRDVAAGHYDFYIRKWASELKGVASPVFVRFGHEMNDPYRYPWGPQNNTAEDFKAAWRHIYSLFQEEGVDNVLWIWSPHPAFRSTQEFYPGDSVVDYIGLNTLNYGVVATWSQWWSFDEIVGKCYEEVADFQKPVMLTELGCLNVGGDRSEWFADALEDLTQKYPAVKSVLFFHYSKDNTTTLETLNWQFKKDEKTCETISRVIENWGLANSQR